MLLRYKMASITFMDELLRFYAFLD
jgi:hypothetical protein